MPLEAYSREVANQAADGPSEPSDDETARYRTYAAPGATEATWSGPTIALLDELQGIAAGQRVAIDERAHAPTRRHIGLCRTCGIRAELTFEHFPPRSMGNKTKVRRASASVAIESANPLAFPRKASYQMQRGAGANVLCGPCNSYFGSNYVPALAAFAKVVFEQLRAHVENTGRAPGILELKMVDWEVGDIARGGLVSVMAQGVHDHLMRRHPELTGLVRGNATGIPAALRLGLTMIVDGSVRASPPQAVSSSGNECVFMEMAAPPFAWTLSFMGEGRLPLERTADVSDWLSTPSGVRRSTTLLLPVGSCHSPLPGDFRPRHEIEAEIAKNTV